MLKIGVFFRLDGLESYPLNSAYFRSSYASLSEYIEKNGAKLYIVRSNETYLGEGMFSRFSYFEGGGLVQQFEPIKLDVLYDKGRFQFDDMPVLGGRDLNKLCVDKLKIHEMLPEFSAKTFFVDDSEGYLRVLNENFDENEMVVVKPNTGAGGRGVRIRFRDEQMGDIPEWLGEGVLVQEFIDSSCGIKGVIDGLHDLRLVLLNGEVVYGLLRQPPEGGLVANVALGGSLRILEPKEIPSDFVKLAKEIDVRCFAGRFENRLIGYDFVNTVSKGIKLMEINSSPGLSRLSGHVCLESYYDKLAKTLVGMGEV